MMEVYGVDIDRPSVGCLTLCSLVSQLGGGSRVWLALAGNDGMSVDQMLMASLVNQMRLLSWGLGGGKGKKPELIEFSGGGKKNDVRYGVSVSTDDLIKYMGNHIPGMEGGE